MVYVASFHADLDSSWLRFWYYLYLSYTIQGKIKAIPLQALTGPEGSRRLRLPDFNTLRTGDANLRLFIQFWKTDDANLHFNTRLVFTHLITQYMEQKKWSIRAGFFLKKWLYFELMICDKYRGKYTSPQSVKTIGTWRWQGCQPYAPAAFTPRKYAWYSFPLGAESTPGP
jgi:hypothetical protein